MRPLLREGLGDHPISVGVFLILSDANYRSRGYGWVWRFPQLSAFPRWTWEVGQLGPRCLSNCKAVPMVGCSSFFVTFSPTVDISIKLVKHLGILHDTPGNSEPSVSLFSVSCILMTSDRSNLALELFRVEFYATVGRDFCKPELAIEVTLPVANRCYLYVIRIYDLNLCD